MKLYNSTRWRITIWLLRQAIRIAPDDGWKACDLEDVINGWRSKHGL